MCSRQRILLDHSQALPAQYQLLVTLSLHVASFLLRFRGQELLETSLRILAWPDEGLLRLHLRPQLINELRTASGGSSRAIARPEPGIRRGPREGWNPRKSIRPSRPDIRSGSLLNPRDLRSGLTAVASNRTALAGDPQPEKANRTGFPFIGTEFRPSRTAEPSVRTAERMNGCAERSNRTAVPSKIRGGRLNARGFPFARSPVRTNGTWERMNGSPEPMHGSPERLLGFAERLAVRREEGLWQWTTRSAR